GDAPKRVFFTNSGAESVEAAFKLARYHTGRPQMIAFWGGFHGRTFGAMSLTGSKVIQRRGFSPLVPGVTHIEYPNPYRNAVDPVEHLEKVVFRRTVAAEEVAAIVVEPIQGEGGYVVPPADFLPRLKWLCERHGILLIADEVQSGMGRTGKMFACEHVGVEPDILCTAKGIASGLPLGAIIARSELMTWPPGSHASTFGGNPVACAAALETIAILEEGLMDHATQMGDVLQEQLRRLQHRFGVVGDVRGLGLMVGMELVQDRRTKEPAAKLKEQLIQSCFHRGLLMLGCGESTLRFCPPLVVDAAQIASAVQIIEASLIEAGCRVENGAAA
ncbi:MAG TPA: aminotransferase class III-fold pyridoxal phosphate-dependent enzyme, partial [Planctomycetaceae bacterium]|nr:aminotransferase class III-fold pyridoxal phosphate-dependent enzyme [Planctomycetaceae bacterium]